jgi:hypothetical protein
MLVVVVLSVLMMLGLNKRSFLGRFFSPKNEPDEAELVAENDEAAAAALAHAPGRGLVSD